MAYTSLEKLFSLGTAAERAAFTPDPPAGVLTLWFETDTGDTYAWDMAAWVLVGAGVGSGLTTTNIHAATSKTTPVDADETLLLDSAASFGLKKLTWANIKATAKTYFDTLYAPKGAATASGLTMATARLLGRTTASTGAVEEISVDSTLSLTGGVLGVVSGAGIFGPYADTSALQAAKPAASNPGAFAYVGASAPYAQYVSNGSAWVVSGGGTPGGSTTQLQFNDAGAFAGASGLTWDKTTNTLTFASGAQTASNPLSYSQTFNNAAVDFVGKSNDFTNTASGAGTVLERWRVGGTTYFSISKTGSIIVGNQVARIQQIAGYTHLGYVNGGAGLLVASYGADSVSGHAALIYSTLGIRIRSADAFGWSSNGELGNANDTALARNAAGVVEVNNGTAGAYRDLRARNLRTEPTAVASLVAASTAGLGAMATANDLSATTTGITAVGGGSNKGLCWSNGTNWIVVMATA